MVLNCVAYKCNNLHDKRNPISFHSFPFKRPEVLELWVKAIQRANWAPSRTSRLCSAHFLPTDFLKKPGCTAKILKPDAVPSIFSFPKHSMKKLSEPRRRIIKHEPQKPIPIDIPLPSTLIESTKIFVDTGTQTAANSTVTLLRRRIKSLKQKIRRRDMKISTLKHVIRDIKNCRHSNESLDLVLKNHVEVPVSSGSAGGSQELLSTVRSPITIAISQTLPPKVESVSMTSGDLVSSQQVFQSNSKDMSTVVIKNREKTSGTRSKNSSLSSQREKNCVHKNKMPQHEMPSTSNQYKVFEEVKSVNTMLSCEDCGKSYKKEINHKCVKIKVGKTEDKQFLCPECKRFFSCKAHLNNHVRSHESYINKMRKYKMGKERFVKGKEIQREEFHPAVFIACHICDKKFPSQRQLDQHVRSHERVIDEDENPSVIRCVSCNGWFELQHYKQVHVHDCLQNANSTSENHNGSSIALSRPVAIRTKSFDNQSVSSGDGDHYQRVEVLEHHLEDMGVSKKLPDHDTDTEMPSRYMLK